MRFSVIVPTYNRLSLLQRTVESILQQDFRDFELIVVNDGSTDGTDEYLKRLEEERKIQSISRSNRGPASARNAGLAIARGDYVAFTDDDCIVPPDWLSRFDRAFRQSRVDFIGGKVKNCVEGNIVSEVSQEITNYFVSFAGREGKSTTFLTSNNIAYRTEAIRASGGFDERFKRAGGEERTLNRAILRNGGKSTLLEDLSIDHYHTLTLGSFCRQQRNYGRGSYLLYRLVGKNDGSFSDMMPLSVYGSLMISLFGGGMARGFVKAMLVVTSQLMVLIGFLTEAMNPAKPAAQE